MFFGNCFDFVTFHFFHMRSHMCVSAYVQNGEGFFLTGRVNGGASAFGIYFDICTLLCFLSDMSSLAHTFNCDIDCDAYTSCVTCHYSLTITHTHTSTVRLTVTHTHMCSYTLYINVNIYIYICIYIDLYMYIYSIRATSLTHGFAATFVCSFDGGTSVFKIYCDIHVFVCLCPDSLPVIHTSADFVCSVGFFQRKKMCAQQEMCVPLFCEHFLRVFRLPFSDLSPLLPHILLEYVCVVSTIKTKASCHRQKKQQKKGARERESERREMDCYRG